MMFLKEKSRVDSEPDMKPAENSVCYICGKQVAAGQELCSSCAQVIRASLKSLYIDEAVY